MGLLIGIAFTLPLLAPSFVFAQETSPADGYVPCGRDVYKAGDTIPSGKLLSDLKNPCGFDDALELARRIIVGWIMAGVIIATLGFAYAGYLYITAMGSEEKIKHAHSIFVKVIFGFVFMLSAWLIARVFEETFLCGPTDSNCDTGTSGRSFLLGD